MQLAEFFDYKNQLMKDILTNEKIIDLVDDEKKYDSPAGLAYTQIFPCEYVPETVQEGKTFICFDVDIQSSLDKTYYSPIIYVWVFTHRSKLRLPNGGGVRTDRICEEISKAINGSREYGLGQLNLYAVKRFAPMTDFNGKCMIFHTKDFNRQYDPSIRIPVNRKDNNG